LSEPSLPSVAPGSADDSPAERAFRRGDWAEARRLARERKDARTLARFRTDPAVVLLYLAMAIAFVATVAATLGH